MNQASIIKVIGVGGGGTNAVTQMYNLGIRGVDFAVCNTDQQSLDISTVPTKIQLGPLLTVGRGAGNNPEVGRQACLESAEELRRFLEVDTKMLFITAGMGGGTGTGAAPIIAKVARELGILTVGIVTLPFQFEGPRRGRLAFEGLDQLKQNVDSLIVISNNKLREMYGNLSMSCAFSNADNILATAAKGIAEIITVPGYINVDFEDVNFVMKESGVSIMGSALARGEDRARKVIESALNSPLLEDNDIRGAKHILLNITTGKSPEITMDEVGEITEYIQQEAGYDTDLIWGSCVDESLEDQISVTLIATGFGQGYKNRSGQETVKKVVIDLNEDEVDISKSEIDQPSSAQTVEFEDEFTSPSSKDNGLNTLSFYYQESTPKKEESKLPEIKSVFNKPVSGNKPLTEGKNLADAENTPAYERRNVRLDRINSSAETTISRTRIFMDEENKLEIREENSFLHDNVD
ncbi:MAG: cell division protein FtsZ [Saprospiraceae bacterium]|nr:cell division protein FtsZ [Candidatus Vicinibacter affinis]MBP6173704.1 cell division protein FtsZ [Saprospiraceae bacterium]MBK6572737.1 cell division protein FtsZ [Candidatus Vicinibacter affinis]MBK6824515.1 cell division protein FtsZ [Candidatus Vicinibacter affinis]MBK7303408.1 cell division protein FtsZ [Candidatus Vicinibacter affinis]